jgi:hypothetical protein
VEGLALESVRSLDIRDEGTIQRANSTDYHWSLPFVYLSTVGVLESAHPQRTGGIPHQTETHGIKPAVRDNIVFFSNRYEICQLLVNTYILED